MEKEARIGRLWIRMKLGQGKWNVELRFARVCGHLSGPLAVMG